MIGKKASVKAIQYAQKLTTEKLPLNSSWEKVGGVVLDARQLEISIYMHCKREGDYTDLSISKVGEDQYVDAWKLPNSECWDEKSCDFDWNYIYKYITEQLMKQRTSRASRQAAKQAKAAAKSTTVVDVTALMKEVALLRTRIKDSTGKEKRALIEEYNQKSKILDAQIERNNEIQKEAKQKEEEKVQQAASADTPSDLKAARKERDRVYMRIRDKKVKGKEPKPEDVARYNYLVEYINKNKG